jgi:hypothetical protein
VQIAATFRADVPADLKVGDKLAVEGRITVRRITGDLVEITSLGASPEFTLGGVEIDAYANDLTVTT